MLYRQPSFYFSDALMNPFRVVRAGQQMRGFKEGHVIVVSQQNGLAPIFPRHDDRDVIVTDPVKDIGKIISNRRIGHDFHGNSLKAEMHATPTVAVKPDSPIRMGDALVALGRKLGLTNKDFAVFEQIRDKTPAKPNSPALSQRADTPKNLPCCW